MNVVMIGAGYVGLVSGACFSEFGAQVQCVDLDRGRIDRLNAGEMPIYEPGLAALVQRNREAGRLSFTTDLGSAVRQADLVFIAVGTPPAGATDTPISTTSTRPPGISRYTSVATP